MFQKIKIIGGLGLGAVVVIYGLIDDRRDIAAATERYSLTEAGEVFAKSCRSALRKNDQEFSSGRSATTGCACVAAEMAKTYEDDLAASAIVMTAMVEMTDAPQDQAPDWAALAARANIDEVGLGGQISVNMAAMGVCNAAG